MRIFSSLKKTTVPGNFLIFAVVIFIFNSQKRCRDFAKIFWILLFSTGIKNTFNERLSF